jgi:hypothetical protein
MPSLAATLRVDFPYRVEQQVVKEGARNLFAPSYPQVDRAMNAFDNTGGISLGKFWNTKISINKKRFISLFQASER